MIGLVEINIVIVAIITCLHIIHAVEQDYDKEKLTEDCKTLCWCVCNTYIVSIHVAQSKSNNMLVLTSL
jgi:hypothetical protein